MDLALVEMRCEAEKCHWTMTSTCMLLGCLAHSLESG